MIKTIIPRFFNILFLAAIAVPGMAGAQELILDTGTPPGNTALPILSTGQWLAAEFKATAGETLSQFSAYLAPNNGSTGNTFSFVLYGGNIVGARNLSQLYSTTGTFSGTTGWSSASADYTIANTGDYWLAVEENATGTEFDVPEETSTSTGPAPALAFAIKGASTFQSSSAGFGLEVSVVPEPVTYGILAGFGLLGVSLCGQFRRKQA